MSVLSEVEVFLNRVEIETGARSPTSEIMNQKHRVRMPGGFCMLDVRHKEGVDAIVRAICRGEIPETSVEEGYLLHRRAVFAKEQLKVLKAIGAISEPAKGLIGEIQFEDLAEWLLIDAWHTSGASSWQRIGSDWKME